MIGELVPGQVIDVLKHGYAAWKLFEAKAAVRSAAEFEWVRRLQREERRGFSQLAYSLPRNAAGRQLFTRAPLLCRPEWIPDAPVRLGTPDEELQDDTGQLVTTGAEPSGTASHRLLKEPGFLAVSRTLLPQPANGAQDFRLFTDAISIIERPHAATFESRPSYALTGIAGANPVLLEFAGASYFDYVNCGELLAYEAIRRSMRTEPAKGMGDIPAYVARLDDALELRDLAGEWDALALRPSVAGVNMLTLFVDRHARKVMFPMMHRSHTATGRGTYHVIPAGEFQPTSESPVAWSSHCTLWQTVLREFAEEILLDAESKSSGLDMGALANRKEMRPLVHLVRSGDWKAWYMGTALDPLTLKPEMLLVSVIDLHRFVEAVGLQRLPKSNAEGEIIAGSGWGEPLNATNLDTYRDHAATLPAASGCIELLQRNMDLFGEHLQ